MNNRYYLIRFFVLAFFLFDLKFINAQNPSWTIYNPSNSGLPSNHVKSLCIESNGTKWAGTWGAGLAKFDGTNWTTFNTSNSGIPWNYVYAIAIDGSGNKWIGLEFGGLAKFDGTNWTVYTTSNSGLPYNGIGTIAIESGNILWIGTVFYGGSGAGIARFDGTTWAVYNTSNSGLPDNSVHSITVDASGNKWIGTNGGIAKFDGTNWTVYNTSNSGIPANSVYAIAIDINGDKWIATGGGGVAKFDGSNWTVYNTLPGNGWINSLTIDKSGNKWIAPQYGGLNKFDNTNWTVYLPANSGIPSSWIQNIAVDSSGNKWLGTDVGGLAKLTDQIIVTSPNGGETWKSYNQYNITWSSYNVQNVKIEYTTNNGTNWLEVIDSYPAGSGSYQWTVPNVQFKNCKIRISDAAHADAYDLSDNTFLIRSTTINVPAVFSTIQSAVDAAMTGDTVLVSPGRYYENVVWGTKLLVVGSLFLTTGDTSFVSQTIIDGQLNGLYGITIGNMEYDTGKVFTGFTITNCNPGGLHIKTPIYIHHVRTINNIGNGIDIFPSQWALVVMHDIVSSYNTLEGIHHHLAKVKLDRIIVANNGRMGIWLQSGIDTISNVLAINNDRGIYCWNSRLDIFNCTFVNNNYGIWNHEGNALIHNTILSNFVKNGKGTGSSVTRTDYNMISSGQNSFEIEPASVLVYGSNNKSSEPIFVSPQSGNYSLSDYSQGIGEGTLTTSVPYDINLYPRPDPPGSNPDIGAFENPIGSPIHNTKIYVSITGNDTGSVGLQNHPFRNIQSAINYSVNGDTVVVYPGTYQENIIYNGKEILLTSRIYENGDTSYISNTIIDGTYSASVVRFNNNENNNSILQGFTIMNGYSNLGAGIYAENASPTLKYLIVRNCHANGDIDGGGGKVGGKTKISYCQFLNNKGRKGGALEIQGAITDTAFIENSIFKNNNGWECGSALMLMGGNRVVVNNSVFNGNYGGPPIWCQGAVATFLNSTIVDNYSDQYGLSTIYMVVGSVKLRNTILRNNSPHEVASSDSPTPTSVDIQYSNIRGGYPGVGNIDAKSIFLDTIYYSPSIYSPDIGSGNITGAPPTDILGNPRPNPSGSNPDIGAVESPRAFFKLQPPSLVNVNNFSVHQPVNNLLFNWRPVYGAAKYHFQLATDTSFTTPVVSDTNIVDTSRIVNSLLYSQQYFWRARGVNSNGTGDWSNVWTFTTIMEAPEAPALLLPANNSKNLPLTLQLSWNPAPRAEKYYYEISTDSLFNTGVTGDSLSVTSVNVSLTNYLSWYYWRVKSFNIGGISSWSYTWKFRTTFNAPQAVSPVNGATGMPSTVTLIWNTIPEASHFHLQVATDSIFTQLILNDSLITQTTKEISGLLPLTSYYWRIRGGNNDGYGEFSGKNKFMTMGSPAVITTLYPTNNSVNIPVNPTFIWNSGRDLNKMTNNGGASLKETFVNLYWFELSADTTNATVISRDTILTDTTKSITGLNNLEYYYWRVKGKNEYGWGLFTAWVKFKTVISGPTGVSLVLPGNHSGNQPLNNLTLRWNPEPNAASYRVQVATDSLFAAIIIADSSITSTTKVISGLVSATKYYWRVQAKNISGYGPFSDVWDFVTVLTPPNIQTISAGNKRITLNWTQSPTNNLVEYIIYRDESSPAITPIDTVTFGTLTYTDNLVINGVRYYYRIKVVSVYNTQSDFSNERNAMPFNIPPVANSLSNINLPNFGRVPGFEFTYSSNGSSDPDGTIDSIYWYLNGTLVSHDTSFTYNFGQGTNQLQLVVRDTDGAKDTSEARVNISVFKKYFNGPVYGGLSLIGDNLLFAVASNDKIYRMNENGALSYTINVNGNILSSSSIAYDTTLYIGSSDNNLYAFSKMGTSLWPPIPLGGTLTATPTIDSAFSRIYIGVSNGNFIAVNRNNGTIAWSYFADAPISHSAVITIDNKLVFTTTKGTIYGFQLQNPPLTTPSWIINNNDSISTSPAIDNEGYFYVGTSNGMVKKISMMEGLQGTIVWETILGGEIIASPVIDSKGDIYVGSGNGNFYSINRNNGAIKWTYNSGSSVKTTAAISPDGNIYFANNSGKVFALDSLSNLLWYYQDSSAIGSAILHHNNTTYIGTHTGRVLAFYDENGSSSTIQSVDRPMWGSFQGNNQRTGKQTTDQPTSVDDDFTEMPEAFALSQNYPNPFNPSTMINYQLPLNIFITLRVFDILGNEVAVLVDEVKEAGYHSVRFDAGNIATGIYFYQLKAGDFVNTKKLILMK